MNTNGDCNCCAPATCDACMPQCSSQPHVRIRAERPLKHEFVCSSKNCNIFGGHDTNPIPEYPFYLKSNKIRDEYKNEKSLGSPIGLVASHENFKNEAHELNVIGTRYSVCLNAFARLHLNDEMTWDAPLLDDIVKEGLNLYAMSQKRESDAESVPVTSDIYMAKEVDILREFELSGFKFHVELMPQFKLNTSNSSEIGARGDGAEHILENFMAVMESFFRQHTYCLLKVDSFYAMIWRTKDAYFVFDVCGRNLSDFRTDADKGVTVLMCFKSLHNVRHLIVNLSRLKARHPLIIRELKLVKAVTPNGVVLQKYYGKRTHEYKVVNDDYAYLQSELHLSLNSKELLRNRSGLPVAVAAIVASKIEHPATWDMKMVDRIICFGVNFCQSHWLACKDAEAIDVNEYPTYFLMGQFHVNIELESPKYKGIWRCVPDFKHGELAHNINKAFDSEHCKLVLQINQQMYAIWKKHDFIYLCDPYRHRILGKENDSQDYGKMKKTATVRMFRSFEVFMNVLNNILLDSNRTSEFFIHVVKVKNIQAQQMLKPGNVTPIEEPKLNDYGEVISINEHICFEEAEDTCKAALGEISDYEDEDLKSDVVEIELKTSTSEEEVADEEELFDEGEWEEMDGVESSSSEGGTRRKRPVTGGRRGRGGRGVASRGKGARKGGRKRTKKGKGAKDSEGRTGGDKSKKRRRRGKKTKKGDETESSDEEVSKGTKKGGKKSKGEKRDEGHSDSDSDEGSDQDRRRERRARRRKGMGEHDDDDDDLSGDTDESTSTDLSGERSGEGSGKRRKDRRGERGVERRGDRSGASSGTSKEKSSRTDRDDSDFSLSDHALDRRGRKRKERDGNKENKVDNDFEDIDIEQVKEDGKYKKWAGGKGGEKTYRRQDRRKQHADIADDIEADDENEECFIEKPQCSIPNPNRYPGFCKFPADMAFIRSECGSYESICKLFQAGFKVADRLLLMTPWGSFVIFRCAGNAFSKGRYYFLFDGCTCNFERFRHLDLSVGTAGLLCFEHTHNVIEYIRHLRKSRRNCNKEMENTADDICKEYCNKISNLRL